MSNYVLFLPYGYGFNTRAKTSVHKISLAAIFFVPVLINTRLMAGESFNLLTFIIVFTINYTVYEIGYIYNDIYTAKRELNPTKWIKTQKMEKFADKKFPLLVSIRVFYIAVGILYLLARELSNLRIFILLLAMLDISFAFHNSFRGKANILTDGALNLLKYISPMVIFVKGNADYRYMIFLYFETAFVRTVEFGIGNRYILPRLWKYDVDKRRLCYYSILFIVAVLCAVADETFLGFAVGAGYMFLYRTLCVMAMKFGKVENVRKQNGSRER